MRIKLMDYYTEVAKRYTEQLMRVLSISVEKVDAEEGTILLCDIAADRIGLIKYLSSIDAIVLIPEE